MIFGRRQKDDAATTSLSTWDIYHVTAGASLLTHSVKLTMGAAYAFGSGGIARFDAATTVMVGEAGIAGTRPQQAWRVAGPAFVALGGGARYAFSQRAAFSTGIGLDLALGPSAFALLLAPEMSVQYGF